jgi:hypothetical protein
MRITDHFDVLERYYRLYNERDFSSIHQLLADEVTSFRPEMPGRRPLEPTTLPRDQFVTQLASCRDRFGTITMRSCDHTINTITAVVDFGAGYSAGNTVIFSGNLISSTFVYRRDSEQRIQEAIA